MKQHLYHSTQFSTRSWGCTKYFLAKTGQEYSTWLPTYNHSIMLGGSPLYSSSGGSFWAIVRFELYGLEFETANLEKVIVLNMFIAVVQENFDVTEDEKRIYQVKAFLQNKDYSAPTQG